MAVLAGVSVREAVNTHLDARTSSPILELIDPVAVKLCGADSHAKMYPVGYGLSTLDMIAMTACLGGPPRWGVYLNGSVGGLLLAPQVTELLPQPQ